MSNQLSRLCTTVIVFVIIFFGFVFLTSPAQAYYFDQGASYVEGQIDFFSSTAGGSSTSLNFPESVATDGNRVFIADANNNRVLVFNSFPYSINPTPDLVIGQPDFSSNLANQGGNPRANTLSYPTHVLIANGKLIIADEGNNRVLIYNTMPVANNANADVVIGQTDFSSEGAGTTASTFNGPWSVGYGNDNLLVADSNNNRVLIFNGIPTNNGASARQVIGQTSLTASTVGTTSATLNFPVNAQILNSKILVSDYSNNRVLVFNTFPTSNAPTADVVIGQSTFTNNTANAGGIGANTLSAPMGLGYDGRRLLVNDSGNSRVLLFNDIPTSNNQAAYSVLGQGYMNVGSANQGSGINQYTLDGPRGGLAISGTTVLVTDSSNNRVLTFFNTVRPPKVTVNKDLQGRPNGLLRMSGAASIPNTTTYTINLVEYQVNGGGWQSATPKDGTWDETNENFYFDFDPKSNNPGSDGYVVRIRCTTSNLDMTERTLVFDPFTLQQPVDGATVNSPYPKFEFRVNKQHQLLTDNLFRYQIWTKRPGTKTWRFYLSIPVDYASVRNSKNNLQRIDTAQTDGTYEDKTMTVTYRDNNSDILAQGKDPPGKYTYQLYGSYEWKVVAVDNAGGNQETGVFRFEVPSRRRYGNSIPFPLTVEGISGVHEVNLSTLQLNRFKSGYYISQSDPSIYGIAPVGSTVTLFLQTDQCHHSSLPHTCEQLFTTAAGDNSRFGINLPANTLQQKNRYWIRMIVSRNENYNELPPFILVRR